MHTCIYTHTTFHIQTVESCPLHNPLKKRHLILPCLRHVIVLFVFWVFFLKQEKQTRLVVTRDSVEGGNKQAKYRGHLGSAFPLYYNRGYVYYNGGYVIINLSQWMECTTPRVYSNVSYELQVIMVCMSRQVHKLWF